MSCDESPAGLDTTPVQALHLAQASAVETLARACARLPIRHAASVDALRCFAASTGEEFASLARTVVNEGSTEIDSRVKALEALAEASKVSCKQLEALARMCDSAAGSGDAGAVEAALAAYESMRPLLEGGEAPVEAYCVMDTGGDAALMLAEECGGVERGAGVVCEGKGLHLYSSVGGENVFRVVCCGDSGAALESVCDADVDVVVEGGTVSSCAVVAPGTVEVCYGVLSAVKAVSVCVSAFGCPVAGSPWNARGSFANRYVRSMAVGMCACAVCVSPDSSLMAVCDYIANEIRLFRLPDGALVRKLKKGDVGVRPPFGTPFGACFSADDANIIVADMDTQCLHETSITGVPLRCIRSGNEARGYHSVSTDGSVVVACTMKELVVFDYATAAVLRTINSYPPSPGVAPVNFTRPAAVELTADKHILMPDSDGSKLLKFTLEGEYVTDLLSSGWVPIAVAETESGELVIAEFSSTQFRILGPGREEVLTPPDREGIRDVTAVTSRGRSVYVLDQLRSSVFVYE